MGTHYQGTDEEVRALNCLIKLARASETVAGRAATHLARGGITETQFGVLEALYHLGPMRIADLAAKHLRSRGTLTLVVDNLAKAAYVRREASTCDRRSTVVHLTDQGRALIARLFPEHVKETVQIMNALTPEEQDELGRLCKKLGTAKPF